MDRHEPDMRGTTMVYGPSPLDFHFRPRADLSQERMGLTLSELRAELPNFDRPKPKKSYLTHFLRKCIRCFYGKLKKKIQNKHKNESS